MKVRRLAVEGALEFIPQIYTDDRGLFVSPFQGPTFSDAAGRPPFRVAQTSYSVSRRGVVRGVHYTLTPPGCEKYVFCARGAAIDIVVDLRRGSPTYGAWDAVRMDLRDFRSIYFPMGVGHAFIALSDDTVMSYLLSASYVPEHELAVSVHDPDLKLPIPPDLEVILSDRDRAAPTLAEAEEAGRLPDYRLCQRLAAV